METFKKSSHPHPVLSQTENNTTLWIGHLQNDPADHFGGQTFTCPSDGQLDNIQLFAAAVQKPGRMQLTIHEFDAIHKIWGPSIGESVLDIYTTDNQQWIQFNLSFLFIKKDITYGFRVHSADAMIGLGEAAHNNSNPFTFGHEWKADSKDQQGHYLSYFSLAFKIELRA